MRFKNFLFYTLILFFFHNLCAQTSESQTFLISQLDSYVLLTQKWKFEPGDRPEWKNLEFDDSSWNEVGISKKWSRNGYKGIGIGWYRLTLKLPELDKKARLSVFIPSIVSAAEIYFDGVLLGSKGKPSVNASEEILFAAPHLFPIPQELIQKSNKHLLAIRVSNHQHSTGFVSGVPAIGLEVELQNREFKKVLFIGCFLGLIFTSFIYHLLIFFGRRKDWNYFYFACLTLFLLIYFVCHNSLTETFGHSNALFHYKITLEYISCLLASMSSLLFLVYQFDVQDKRLVKFYCLLVSPIVFLILFFPPSFFTKLLSLIHISLFLAMICGIYIIIRCLKAPGALPIIISMLVFFLSVTIDIIMVYSSIHNLSIVKYGFSFCILALSLSLAQKFNHTNLLREQLQKVLIEQNRIFQLFVPKKYLARITRGGGMECIRVGNAEEAMATILFTDIRGFTTFAESKNPRDVFLFLNEYFTNMGQCIEIHDGFIDKYIGDAIMAVFDFPEVEAPLRSAIEMRKALDNYNKENPDKTPVAMGIGLNTGKTMMGTVGSETRMDSTVIGDSVNLSSRLESLTKTYLVSILISEFTYKRINKPELFDIRCIDRVIVKGRHQAVEVFEVFDVDPPEIRKQKKDGLKQWTVALEYYFVQRWETALEAFKDYQKQYSKDRTAQVFIERCEKELQEELPK